MNDDTKQAEAGTLTVLAGLLDKSVERAEHHQREAERHTERARRLAEIIATEQSEIEALVAAKTDDAEPDTDADPDTTDDAEPQRVADSTLTELVAEAAGEPIH